MFLGCIEICHHENFSDVIIRFKLTLNSILTYSASWFYTLALKANLYTVKKSKCLLITWVIYCLKIAVVEHGVISMYEIGLLSPVNLCNPIRASNASVEQLSVSLRNSCHVVAKRGIACQVIQSHSGDVSPVAGEVALCNFAYGRGTLYLYPAASHLSVKVCRSAFSSCKHCFGSKLCR